ncbi:MAG: CrcB family protein [Sulfuritalea sp.]|nr:CrcB family protein [Sulfuritalea sp.]
MNPVALLAIGVGAVLGAWLRYGLGLWLNPMFVAVPMGTLAANLIGGYLVGVAVMVFHLNAEMPPELKLFFITGFLGALTALHLFGSLLMTGLGIFTIHKLAQ